jgi:biotin operon repressor
MRGNQRKVRALHLHRARFAEVERLAVYEIANTVLLAHNELQRAFGLRAEEFQVFYLIAIATAQRHVRSGSKATKLPDAAPLAPGQSGAISCRKIAETLDIPLDTVRRHVEKLLARGLMVERGRGRFATPGKTLAKLSTSGVTTKLARQQVALANVLIKLGGLLDGRWGTAGAEAGPTMESQSASTQICSASPPSSDSSSRSTAPSAHIEPGSSAATARLPPSRVA